MPGYEDEPLATMERQIFNCMLPGDYHLETLKLCKEVRSALTACSRVPPSVPAGGCPGVQLTAPGPSDASPRRTARAATGTFFVGPQAAAGHVDCTQAADWLD